MKQFFCMNSYLPDSRESCLKCPYYGSVQVDKQVSTCKSSEAHKMAIKALQLLKERKSC